MLLFQELSSFNRTNKHSQQLIIDNFRYSGNNSDAWEALSQRLHKLMIKYLKKMEFCFTKMQKGTGNIGK